MGKEVSTRAPATSVTQDADTIFFNGPIIAMYKRSLRRFGIGPEAA